ncbi:MAG: prolipoprotein diacylglyceryl transferase [Acidobacteriota bacterium]
MHPILIDLGFWQIPSYGVLLAIGVVVGLWRARVRAVKHGLDGDRIVDLGLWIVIWGLLGSKLLLVVVELPRYFKHPGELLMLFRAGGVFLGGFIAAVIAAIVLIRKYNLPALKAFDALTPSVSLSQAIGRLGCLAAGCCWGGHCDLPWAITYTDPRAAEALGTPLGVAVHPFPIYAVISNLAIYGILAWMYQQKLRTGRVFAAYLILYGASRFLLEETRGDAVRGFVFDGTLSTSQLITAIMIAAGIALQVWLSRRRES